MKLNQVDLLKASVERLQAKNGGQDSPFVKGLKAQIASHEKPRAENPMDNSVSVGMRSPNPGEASTPPTKDSATSG